MRARELGGVDVFHLVRHHEMRRLGLPGNVCLFVIELDGHVDERALERRSQRAIQLVPELGQRAARGFPPKWKDGATPPVAEVFAPSRSIDDALAAPISPDAPWGFDRIPGARGDTIVFRWFHPMADGKAAERLVRWLGSGEGDALDPPPREELRWDTGARPIAKLDRAAKYQLMKAYNAHVLELAAQPIMSPATRLPRDREIGRTRALRVTLDEAATKRFDARVRDVAKLAETSVMIVASLRALDRLLLARGFAPPHYLVPVPLSLDPKAQASRILGNNLTMMMFSLSRSLLADERACVTSLAEQQRAIVKKKLDVAMLAALDLARWLPEAMFRAVERVPTHGEIASMIVSNPGAIALDSFAGARVEDAYPVPSVVVPPGIQTIFTRFAGRLSALVVTVDGVVANDEAQAFARALRAELDPS